MTSQITEQETRTGIIFTGKVEKIEEDRVRVSLFLEGQDKPIDTSDLAKWETSDPISFLDIAFQRWLISGAFLESITDPELLSILTTAQRERLNEIPWYRKTFRFLETSDSTYQNPRFILTTDKSDLSDRYKRIWEVGEEVVKREEAVREEALRLQEKQERERVETLRAEHTQLIISVVKSAINNKIVPIDMLQTLSNVGLLEPSTSFRSGAQFPGEAALFLYDFTENEVRYAGFIGFDENLQLISIDERLPRENTTYLRK